MRGDRVLWRDDGFPKVSQVLLAKWMCRAQRLAGLKVTGGIRILRHTFCSRLAMAGASTKAIQELAGHEQISMMQRYMHLSLAAKSEAMSLLRRPFAPALQPAARRHARPMPCSASDTAGTPSSLTTPLRPERPRLPATLELPRVERTGGLRADVDYRHGVPASAG